jgi:DNA polymerase-3 subunit delta
MKLDAGRIEGFLRAPGATGLVLIHGPDAGLVAERGLALVKTVLGGVDDPFRFVELHAPEPGTLLAEATAASMTGGRRVVRIRQAGDALVKPVEALLKAPPDALLVFEAGELTAKSRLRSLVEKHPDAVSMACYEMDAAKLPKVLADRMRALGIAVDADAAAWAGANVPGEAGALRQTVEMLALYAGAARHLSLADVMAVLADGGDLSAQDAVDAVLTGDTAGTDRALALAYADGASPVAIVRILLGELLRLRVAVSSGVPAAAAMAAMRPPVFFKRQPAVQKALSLWSLPALNQAIRTALLTEAACKTTHIPDTAYCRQVMLGLASRARNAAAPRS